MSSNCSMTYSYNCTAYWLFLAVEHMCILTQDMTRVATDDSVVSVEDQVSVPNCIQDEVRLSVIRRHSNPALAFCMS